MPVVNGYATLAEAKGWVGLHDVDDDSLLEDIITAVSRWIDNHCGRHFWKAIADTRYFDTEDGISVEFGAFNDVVSVTTLKTDSDNDGTYETTWTASDYQLLPLNVTAPEARPYECVQSTGSKWFPRLYAIPSRVGLVQVVGTFGWPAIPQAVNQACRLQTSREFQRKKSPEGVSGWGEFGPMRISGRLDPDVAEFLTDYRLTRLLVA